MSVTYRLSCLVAALLWLPAAMAQLNPPLTGGAASAAPAAAPVNPAPERPLVRQVPAVPGGAQALPVSPAGSTNAP
ncbi:DUF3613 domain-containing protein, partial [Achromobacter sp. GG226]|nr:DUF3613 domain-containing protein [Verticiella sp. GG226]